MSENITDMMLQETNNDLAESEVDNTDNGVYDSNWVEQEIETDSFDITDDFRCGELLLDADEDRAAFKIFLRLAIEEKRIDAIDKLLYIALKNYQNSELIDNKTWEIIELLPEQGKGYEYAYLLLHFKYYSMGGKEDNIVAHKYLVKYFNSCKKNHNKPAPIAYLQKGVCLDFGLGIKVDDMSSTQAMACYQRALKGKCSAAYKYIASMYIFGEMEIPKNYQKAKKIIEKGICYFKDKYDHSVKDHIPFWERPFFEALVSCCYSFVNINDRELEKEMIYKGKETAQYMIDNGIKGGYRLMGDFFITSNYDFNITMAKDYYNEAIKNKETIAYSDLALISLVEGKSSETFKLANKGCSNNHSFSYSILGQIYEQQGDNYKLIKRYKKAQKCYEMSWNYYQKAYYKFGISPENLGHLYLDKGILPQGYVLDDLEQILEIGAKQQKTKAIKYYLRLIQKKNGKSCRRIDSAIVNKLSKKYRDKYIEYLKAGAYGGDNELINEYANMVFKQTDKINKVKLSKQFVKECHIVNGKKQFFNVLKNYKGKLDVDFMVWFAKNIQEGKTGINYDNTNKLPHRYQKEYPIYFKLAADTGDDNIKIRYDEYVDYVFQHADNNTKSNLSKQLIDYSQLANSKKQFMNIVENYNGKQTITFMKWFGKSLFKLFYSEYKNSWENLTNEITDAIENSGNENVKELLITLKQNAEHDCIDNRDLANISFEDLSDDTLMAAINLMLAITNSNNEYLKKIKEKINGEWGDFLKYCNSAEPHK